MRNKKQGKVKSSLVLSHLLPLAHYLLKAILFSNNLVASSGGKGLLNK